MVLRTHVEHDGDRTPRPGGLDWRDASTSRITWPAVSAGAGNTFVRDEARLHAIATTLARNAPPKNAPMTALTGTPLPVSGCDAAATSPFPGATSEIAREGGFGHKEAGRPWAAQIAEVTGANKSSTRDEASRKVASISVLTACSAPRIADARADWDTSTDTSTDRDETD